MNLELALAIGVAVVQLILLPVLKSVSSRLEALDNRVRDLEVRSANTAAQLSIISRISTFLDSAPTRREFDALSDELKALREDLHEWMKHRDAPAPRR